MAVPLFSYTTGPSSLSDSPRSPFVSVGSLKYNGCIFSPLFETTLSGNIVEDNARRTVKYVEYMLTVDGYVTLPDSDTTISPTMINLRNLLTAQGGQLTYLGRGFDLIVNTPGGIANASSFTVLARDVAYGPVPKLIEFQPLGAGLSAKVKWQCKICLNEKLSASAPPQLLQFNCETRLSYGEDGFSSLSVRGTMEIPLTRSHIATRTPTITVDDFRSQLDTRIFRGIDLSVFRVTRREFNISRDKRTMEFDITAEEKPYMDLPPYCTLARGSFNVRPAKSGAGLANWLCTLRATYTVGNFWRRRTAWFNFLALLRLRMSYAGWGNAAEALPSLQTIRPPPPIDVDPVDVDRFEAEFIGPRRPVIPGRAWLIDFSFDEGLYLDSKTISFSATWRLVTNFATILLASGLWRKMPDKGRGGGNLWASSLSVSAPDGGVRSALKSYSWLSQTLNPTLDVIVDFGG
jgi:hypothetical protein